MVTNYVGTLDRILEFIRTYQPTTDRLVEFHREAFDQVSSRSSILRRVDYLEDVRFIVLEDQEWKLGPEGQAYVTEQTTDTLLVFC